MPEEVVIIPEVADRPPNDQWPEPPRLLVEWSSPWDEFKSAFRPALSRAPKALAGEAPIGIFPYRGVLAAWLLECLLLFALIVLPERFESLQVPAPPSRPHWDVIYYSGDELPQTQDLGGAESGKSVRAGGRQAHHRTQAIRVVRGDRPAEKVVDAPKIGLPHSDSAVANLLAFKANPGPPPAEGLRSTLTAPALPVMSVVAPAPDLNASTTRTANTLTANVVAPAPDLSHASSRAALILNATPAVAPPVARTIVAPAPSAPNLSRAIPLTQTVNVVPPPVSAPARDVSSQSKLTLPTPAVIAPPPSQVSRDLKSWGRSAAGDLRVKPVPPPPTTSVAASRARSDVRAITPQVVPPPPSLSSGKAATGSGRGSKGSGSGGPLDLGSAVAPPANSGANANSGVIVSSQPGTKPGVPNSASPGAVAMSPSGTAKSGLGGSEGGGSIGRGNGSGSGLQGEGSGAGAGKDGTGRGSDPAASDGISPYPGVGGSGTGTRRAPAVPGVSVQGGTTTISLPSFGSPNGDTPSTGPGRSSSNAHKGSGITIEATPRSGGVFNYYGLLKGDRNYSIYIETSLGTAVMQYADAASATHPSSENLSAPEPMRNDLPSGLRATRVVIACILTRSGDLNDMKVLEPGAAETTSKILVALHSWKFRPAFRGNEPVEVNAILGFGVDTR